MVKNYIPEHRNGAFPASFLQLHEQLQMPLEIEIATNMIKNKNFNSFGLKIHCLPYQKKDSIFNSKKEKSI